MTSKFIKKDLTTAFCHSKPKPETNPPTIGGFLKKEKSVMTADEAKQALKQHKKVRCKKWEIYDYIESRWGNIKNNYGEKVSEDFLDDFKDDDWEIVE